jgi:uncharacterized membrane protein YtjA (UPF0391 family)
MESCRQRHTRTPPHFIKEAVMLHYALIFFIVALIAALFGFGGLAAGAAGIAKILFFVFLVLTVASFVLGLFKR